MDIKALLPRSHVMLNLKGGSRLETWETLCQPLIKDNILVDIDTFLDDLARREEHVTTRIDDLVALPHARSNSARRLGVVLGISADRRIDYSSEGPGPAVVLLIAVPAFAPAAHLPILQRFARFAHDPNRLKKLLTASTPSQATRTIISFKG